MPCGVWPWCIVLLFSVEGGGGAVIIGGGGGGINATADGADTLLKASSRHDSVRVIALSSDTTELTIPVVGRTSCRGNVHIKLHILLSYQMIKPRL